MILQWKEQKNSKDCHIIGNGNVQKIKYLKALCSLRERSFVSMLLNWKRRMLKQLLDIIKEEKVKFNISDNFTLL